MVAFDYYKARMEKDLSAAEFELLEIHYEVHQMSGPGTPNTATAIPCIFDFCRVPDNTSWGV